MWRVELLLLNGELGLTVPKENEMCDRDNYFLEKTAVNGTQG